MILLSQMLEKSQKLRLVDTSVLDDNCSAPAVRVSAQDAKAVAQAQ